MTPAHQSFIDMKQVSAYSSAPPTKLTPKQELFRLEEDIELHWTTAAAKFQIIKDRELWRADGYTSWKDYCVKRWHKSRQHMYRLLDSAETAKEVTKQIEDSKVSPLGDTPCEIANERQARALKKVPSEKRLKVLKKAGYNGKVTAKKIKEAASDLLENGESVSDYKRPRTPPTQNGKPIYLNPAWKEGLESLGRALNRIDAFNRLIPDQREHDSLIAIVHEVYSRVEKWRERSRTI